MTDRDEAEGYLSRAELLIELGRYDEAREELAGGLLHHPRHTDALTLLAVIELQAGEPADALAAADAALAIAPDDDRALRGRGYALARLGRVDEAIACAERLLDGDRLAWWRHMHYALIRRAARNGQEALDAAWQAVRLAPDHPLPHAALALIAADLGLDDLAERARRAAARLGSAGEADWSAADRLHLQFGRRPEERTPEPAPPAPTGAAPRRTEPDDLREDLEALATTARYGAAFPIAAPLLVALLSGGAASTARVLAVILAVVGAVGLALALRRIPVTRLAWMLRRLDAADRWLEVAVACVAASPVVLAVYAAVASPFLLALTVLLGFLALYAFVMRGR